MIDPTYSQGKGKNDGYDVRCITTMSVDKAPAAAERPEKESGKCDISRLSGGRHRLMPPEKNG
ncbi:hypothetical protein B6I74_01275 [Klebsiella variicola]|nr:hypothetical protein B6I74_01275 [Klebsiella variicola]